MTVSEQRPLGGSVAVVTGASSGIGRATAAALAAQGATVCLLARRRDELDDLARTIGNSRGTAHAYAVDVTDDDQVAAVIASIADDRGGIDVLVNAAGWLANSPVLDADLGDWRQMIEVNLTATLTACRLAAPHLVAAARGPRGVADLVNLSSVAGRKVTSPASNVYAATKFGVGAFSEALRQELAEHQVRVGVIEPGVVRTAMTTTGQKGAPDGVNGSPLLPDDIARAIVYMVTQPAHAAINEIFIRPTEQTI